MNVIRIMSIFVLCALSLLLIIMLCSASRRLYVGPYSEVEPDRSVDLLIVDPNFKLDPLPESIQEVKLQEGMTLLLHNHTVDDGTYIIMNGQMVRLVCVRPGDSFLIASGKYRNSTYTISVRENECSSKKSGDSLDINKENFLVIHEEDSITEDFHLLTTECFHVLTVVNDHKTETINVFVDTNSFKVEPKSHTRVLFNNDALIRI